MIDYKERLSAEDIKEIADFRYKTRRTGYGKQICARKNFRSDEIKVCRAYSQIYSQRVCLSLDSNLTQLNLNTIVLGGSGTGKSRYFVKPNLLQGNSSYVVTDPSGELLRACGQTLIDMGYEVKYLNIEDMDNSMRYNPFRYIYEDADIPLMVDALISNIEGPVKSKGGDSKFWDETSRTLLIAICGYLFETQPMEKRNFTNVVKLMELMDAADDSEVEMDELDKLFADLEKVNPDSYAVSNYKVIKSAGRGKTAQNIIISTLAIFSRFFKLEKIANLTYKDELCLEDLGQKKCALFIITPQANTTYNFIAAELYTQLFDILYKQGHKRARSSGSLSVKLDVPVRMMIDEAGNVGTIPHLENTISTCRKYNISISLIYQNKAQIETLFEKKWETLVGNCDSMLFLGGIDQSTVKLISERLGKETIITKYVSRTKGRGQSSTVTTQSLGRNLKTTTEIEQLGNEYCIVFIRSMKPFLDKKYPLEKHPNYKKSGDYDDKFCYIPKHQIALEKDVLKGLEVALRGDENYVFPDKEKSKQETKEEVIDKFIDENECQMPDEERAKEINNMLKKKKINLSPGEILHFLSLSMDDAKKTVEILEGYDPYSEFDFV